MLVCAGMIACGSIGAAFEDSSGPNASDQADGGGFASPNPEGTALGPTDNAVILVHAAGLGAFRVCFDSALDQLPLPDRQAMPEANVVGVEVGTAVRLPPLAAPVNKVFVYEERLLRGKEDLDCRDLVTSQTPGVDPVAKIDLNADLTRDVHLLVLSGCGRNPSLFDRTIAQCGSDFDGGFGNLKMKDIVLKGANRTSPSLLPTQVAQLSQALESARADAGALNVTFGELEGSGGTVTVTQNPGLLAPPSPAQPIALEYKPDDIPGYARRGFTVFLGGKKLLAQSLADVARLSSPNDLPTTYYAVASNYVLLLLGDPNAKPKADGGAPDELEGLHFLVVPVVEPKADGGADASAPSDGGPL